MLADAYGLHGFFGGWHRAYKIWGRRLKTDVGV